MTHINPLTFAAVAWLFMLAVWFAWVCYRTSKTEDGE